MQAAQSAHGPRRSADYPPPFPTGPLFTGEQRHGKIHTDVNSQVHVSSPRDDLHLTRELVTPIARPGEKDP